MPSQVLPFRRVTNPPLTPARFRSRLLKIMPDCRLLWMPVPNDTTKGRTFESQAGRVVTYDATVATRLGQVGKLTSQSFAVASSQFGTTPDTANLSFGNSTTDQAFSVVVLANVTDTAGNRSLVTKWNTLNLEWIFRVNSTDVLALFLGDSSAGVTPTRASDAAITQGSWHLFGASYDGTGGATALNGATLFVDGAVVASTATNDASYVAMEDLAAAVEIGSFNANTAAFMEGGLALVVVCGGALTTVQHAAIAVLCRLMGAF